MHGEAWVNHAIQECRPAHRARHALRRSRHRQPRRPTRRTRSKIHIDIDPTRDRQERAGRRRHRRRPAQSVLRALLGRASQTARAHRDVARAASTRVKGDAAVRDIQNLPDDGHLYAAHVIHDLLARSPTARRCVVTDVGQHQMWEAQYYQHDAAAHRSSPRAASARWASRCRPRSAPRWRGPDEEVWVIVGDGGFQMTHAGARDDRAGAAATSTSPSSTTATSAWCGSGRSSSTSGATRRRRCAAPTS